MTEEVRPNRVAMSFQPPAPTPSTVPVRSGRFMQSFIRTLTGCAQNAHKTGILGLRHTRLTRSGLSRRGVKSCIAQTMARKTEAGLAG